MAGPQRPLLIGVDRYVLRAFERRDAPAVLVYGPGWRDGGLPPVPRSVTAVFTEDERSPEAVLSAIRRAGLSGEHISSVSTTSEFSLVNAALVARALGCRGISPEAAVLFRDKWLQKQALRERGIPTAASVVVDDLFAHALEELPFERCVLKPVGGVATRQTSKLRSIEDFHATARAYRAKGGSARTFVIEDFQDGEEWVVDGVVFDGEVIFSSVGVYAQPCLSTIETQEPLRLRRFDPVTESWASKLAGPIVGDALEALGLRDGVFHMELFHADGEISFGECAARRGGGLIHEQIECKFGVDLGEAACSIALGERPDLHVEERRGIVGTAYVPAVPGLLFASPTVEEITGLAEVEYALLRHPVGATLPQSMSDTTTNFAQVVLRTETPERFDERAAEVLAWCAERVKVLPPNLSVKELRDLQPYLGYSDALPAIYAR